LAVAVPDCTTNGGRAPENRCSASCVPGKPLARGLHWNRDVNPTTVVNVLPTGTLGLVLQPGLLLVGWSVLVVVVLAILCALLGSGSSTDAADADTLAALLDDGSEEPSAAA